MMAETKPPSKIGVLLFPGFQLLDICGPLDVLNILSTSVKLDLTILAATLEPVSTKIPLSTIDTPSNFSESIVPTHTFATAPDDLEVLILPGGFGARKDENIDDMVEFVKNYWAKGGLKYVITVCTGSAILAKTGILDGKRATSNKRAFPWVKEQNDKVEWIAKARWVVDGNIWTSSGISSGIDLIYAWIEHIWGEEKASFIADQSEYERNKDPGNDRYAERWGAV